MQRVLTEEQVDRAGREPPADTRALARGAVIRALSQGHIRYIVDWDSVYLENEHHLSFRDPFETYDDETAAFTNAIRSAPPAPSRPLRRRLR